MFDDIELEELKKESQNRVQEIEKKIREELSPDEYIAYLIENNRKGTLNELINKIKSKTISINDTEKERIAYKQLLELIHNKKNCVICGSDNTIPYYYGVLYPIMIDDIVKLDKDYFYGGLDLSDEKKYHCNDCNRDF